MTRVKLAFAIAFSTALLGALSPAAAEPETVPGDQVPAARPNGPAVTQQSSQSVRVVPHTAEAPDGAVAGVTADQMPNDAAGANAAAAPSGDNAMATASAQPAPREPAQQPTTTAANAQPQDANAGMNGGDAAQPENPPEAASAPRSGQQAANAPAPKPQSNDAGQPNADNATPGPDAEIADGAPVADTGNRDGAAPADAAPAPQTGNAARPVIPAPARQALSGQPGQSEPKPVARGNPDANNANDAVNAAPDANVASNDTTDRNPAPAPAGDGDQDTAQAGADGDSGANAEPEVAIADISERISRRRRPGSDHDKKAYKAIATFYAGRENLPLFVAQNDLSAAGRAALTEMAAAKSWGLDPNDFKVRVPGDEMRDLDENARADLEIAVALAVLKYAYHARGGRIDPSDLSYDIDRERPLKDPETVLGELADASDTAAYLRSLHPKARQFHLLRAAYQRLTTEPDKRQLPTIDEAGYAKAARAAQDAGLPPPPRPNFVKRARKRPSNAKLAQRIVRNMEMWRWMPEDLGETYVIVNIPEYTSHLIENGREVWRERVIVGKIKNQTPLFSDEMELVVFNPLWHVPNSIKVKELLPGLLRGGDPVSRQGLKMKLGSRELNPRSVNWAKVDIRNVHVFQPSGPRNALGQMKFLFPNKHAVYMHDTPSRQLFSRDRRAFSHGCVRTRNPLSFAVQMLRIGKGWSESKTKAVFRSSSENNEIRLDRKIPVHVAYFTAWADEKSGQVRFYDDIYRHERHVQYAFDGKTHLIVKTKPNVNADLQRIRATLVQSRKPQQPTFFGLFGGSGNGGTSTSQGSGSSNAGWRRDALNMD